MAERCARSTDQLVVEPISGRRHRPSLVRLVFRPRVGAKCTPIGHRPIAPLTTCSDVRVLRVRARASSSTFARTHFMGTLLFTSESFQVHPISKYIRSPSLSSLTMKYILALVALCASLASAEVSSDGRCGGPSGLTCPGGACCSSQGYCGTSE